jgi:hypothetical protein
VPIGGGQAMPCLFGDINRSGEHVMDNRWVIEYDMDVARFSEQKLAHRKITPELLFDEGYYLEGVSTTILTLSRQRVVKLAKINPAMLLRVQEMGYRTDGTTCS